MSEHPYKLLSSDAFWSKSVANCATGAVDPVGPVKFTLSRSDRIATAGSCFAQHIARHLSQSGFNYLVTETAHPLASQQISKQFNYGLFTARYANIYTSRQMIQLLKRAYGLFEPLEDMWINDDGNVIDPFRPQIQENGFSSVAEFQADRARHFAAIREAVETLDCLVFTLGLTECWRCRGDNAVYPVCPGVSGGRFDDRNYEFHNLTVSEVLSDLNDLVEFVISRNPSARFIFTVSPVPLVATASGEHVLSATTFSKSILRAAAGEISRAHSNIAYFPSYEIITGSFNRGAYFAADLRSVTEAGVAHVMRLFLQHYGSDPEQETELKHQRPIQDVGMDMDDIVKVICEEEALQQFQR